MNEELEARRAERDRKRAEYEAQMEKQKQESRARHVERVKDRLRVDCIKWQSPSGDVDLDKLAELAYDALCSDGYFLAQFSGWDNETVQSRSSS
ncbi:MAG: hypothetical protein KGL39_04170 [Patescibacteria group bacterium]|nr:hypothetical protein [Patescibacteria group bacterium]